LKSCLGRHFDISAGRNETTACVAYNILLLSMFRHRQLCFDLRCMGCASIRIFKINCALKSVKYTALYTLVFGCCCERNSMSVPANPNDSKSGGRGRCGSLGATDRRKTWESFVRGMIIHSLPGDILTGSKMRSVPKNTYIYVPPIYLSEDAQVWGADAHEFRRERWLEGKLQLPKGVLELPSLPSPTFLAGPQACITF
jgi:hypothetical protein